MSNYKKYSSVCIAILAIIIFLSVMHTNIYADKFEKKRAWVGLNVFRNFLAADMDISGKADHGRLVLVLIYKEKKQTVMELLLYLKKITKKIQGIPVQIELIKHTDLKNYNNKRIAGIYLTQKLFDSELESVIEYGKKNHAIVFSPFIKDVKKGVSGGQIITTEVFPYINVNAMKSSGIRIQPLFFEISKKYKQP